MSFEQQSVSDVLARLKTDLTITDNTATTVEGSFNADMLTANSIEFGQAYNEMNLMIEAAFADTAWNDYLTMKATEMGVDRKQATAAVVTLKITGTAGAPIIKNSLFSTPEDLKFYTTVAAVLGSDGTITVKAQCGDTGTAGNVAAGTITKIPYSIPGVTAVTNEVGAVDGYTEETDAQLLARYLLKVRTPATSGNANHYQEWALSVAGVGQAKVYSVWNGNGTVKVIIVDSNNATASSTLVQAVADYIETVRPIGATVTVTSPAPYPIDICVDIKGVADIDTVKAAVNAYFSAYGFTSTYISYAQIGKILLDSGIISDYKNLIVCGGTSNVPLTIDQIPICGTVTLNVYSS